MAFFFNVEQNHCVIIERFGKYSKTCYQGLRFRIPLIEKVKRLREWEGIATKEQHKIELSEQHSDTPARSAHTKDNVEVKADATVYWRIVDPVRAVYEVDILPQAVLDSALNTLRACIGTLDLDTLLSERETLNDKIAAQLSGVSTKWGIKINRVEIQTLQVSDEASSAMLQQMEAERARRAIVSTSEGKAEATVMVAEAERKARLLRADGDAKAIGLIAVAEKEYLILLSDVVGNESASKILLSQKMLDGFAIISDGDANKVFMPNSIQGLMVGEGM